MQYYKLSFSVLMISTFFIQSASAQEKMEEMSGEVFDLSEVDLNQLIKRFSSTFTKDKVVKNSSVITHGISMNTRIEEKGVEIVENNGTSKNATISKGGQQVVTRGGTAITTQISEGVQFVFEENPRSLGATDKRSGAYETVISGTNTNVGQQNVYDGGQAWITKVKGGGAQYLYKGKTAKGGMASNTEVSSNGKQLVLAGGEALGVTLKERALQVVYPGGIVKDLTIQDQAQSWIHVGASLTGAIKVNGKGCLYLYAGDNINYITKKEITLEGRSTEKLFSVGAENSSRSSEIYIGNLSGNGGTVRFASVGYDKRRSKLSIGQLSGNLHFDFNVSAIGEVGEGSDYIFIKSGSGNHTISVADSGIEIENYFFQKHGRVTEINLVTDTSKNGGVTFTLVDSSGRSIGAVDAGTYMYTLNQRAKSGNSKTWFLSSDPNQSHQISLSPKRFIQKKPFVHVLSTSSSPMGNGKPNNGRSRGQKSQTSRKNSEFRSRPPRHLSQYVENSSVFDLGIQSPSDFSVTTSDSVSDNKSEFRKQSDQTLEFRSRPSRHVYQSAENSLVSSAISYTEYQSDKPQDHHEPKSRKRFSSSTNSGAEVYPILDGSPVLDSGQSQILDFELIQYTQGNQIDDLLISDDEGESSVLNQIKPMYPEENTDLEDLEDQETSPQFVNQDDEQLFDPISGVASAPFTTPSVASAPFTTPSTDAVLSLAVVPELVFNNELQSLRAARGFLEKNKKNTALWTYGIKSKERISTDHTHFNLDQTGIMVGIDWLSHVVNGQFYIGGFGSYDQSDISHARRGVSHVNTCSIGAYATYLGDRGWYLDSVLKYNHYQNNLQAVSTNGLNIKGDYNQKAIGASFETGRHIKLAQDSWTQPYAQLIWLQVKGKEIKLSNEMIGDIGPYTSLRSEIGLSIGHEFNLGTSNWLMTYTKAAWLREYIDNNHTTINKRHKFNTDLSGNAGKFGIGLNSLVSENLNFYAEAHYLKGKKTKRSLQGILGLRYSF
ncbi:MAG: hypothetical protein PG977_000566 [Bartonella clarridgeiae]|nr:MAG: hypothetical protein PG977_000566 [Bartonella clarridgeiae]